MLVSRPLLTGYSNVARIVPSYPEVVHGGVRRAEGSGNYQIAMYTDNSSESSISSISSVQESILGQPGLDIPHEIQSAVVSQWWKCADYQIRPGPIRSDQIRRSGREERESEKEEKEKSEGGGKKATQARIQRELVAGPSQWLLEDGQGKAESKSRLLFCADG